MHPPHTCHAPTTRVMHPPHTCHASTTRVMHPPHMCHAPTTRDMHPPLASCIHHTRVMHPPHTCHAPTTRVMHPPLASCIHHTRVMHPPMHPSSVVACTHPSYQPAYLTCARVYRDRSKARDLEKVRATTQEADRYRACRSDLEEEDSDDEVPPWARKPYRLR